MNEQGKSIIAEMTSSTNPREVSLNDTILVGCNGCGNCCMNAHMCPYLQATNEGDYKCILEDSKPSTCTHPFVAIGTKFTQSEFDFVPLDQNERTKFIRKEKDYDTNRCYNV